MPAKIGWMEMIPEAILDLLSDPDAIVERKTVEHLFDVKPRQAQRILQDAGATVEGKLAVIAGGEFCVYLDTINGSKLVSEEKERRQRFAEKLAAMRRDRIRQGRPLLVEADDRPVKRAGYDGLLPGTTLGRGPVQPIRLVIDADDEVDLLQKLALFASAMQADGLDYGFPGFQEKLLASERPAPGNAQIARSLRAVLDSPELELKNAG